MEKKSNLVFITEAFRVESCISLSAHEPNSYSTLPSPDDEGSVKTVL